MTKHSRQCLLPVVAFSITVALQAMPPVRQAGLPILHRVAAGTGTIKGRVTSDTGQPLGGLVVLAWDGTWDGNHHPLHLDETETDANGNYTIPELDAAAYFVNAYDPAGNRYVDTWYPNVWDTDFWRNLVPARPIVLADGATATVDFSLPLGAHVLLTLKDPGGAPIDVPGNRGCWGAMFVEFNGGRYSINAACFGGFDFNNGSYEPYVVPKGRTYYIEGWPRGSNYTPVFYDQKLSLETATPFTLTSEAAFPITIVMGPLGHSISGRYSFNTPQDSIISATASLYFADGTALKSETPAPDGTFTIGGLDDGDYVVSLTVRASKAGTRTTYVKYYENASNVQGATRISVRGTNVTGINVVMDSAALAAALRTNTTRLDLIAPAGGSSEAAPLSFWTDGGTLSWTATTTTSWLRLSALSGAVSAGQPAQTISVSADASQLQAGSYSDNITIAGSSGAPLQIPVSLQVTRQASASDLPLNVAAPALTFTRQLGQFAPVDVTLTNPNAAPVSWNLRSSFAEAFPSSGTLNGGGSFVVKVAPLISGLDFGSISGLLDVLTNGRITTTLPVIITVSPDPIPVSRASATHTISDIAIASPVLPTVASNLPGARGSLWSSDVFLASLPSSVLSNLVSFLFTPFGNVNGANSLLVRGPVKVPMTMLSSPVQSMFRIDSGFGALEHRPEAALAAWSRVWTPAGDGRGTYGQEIAAFDNDTIIHQGDTGIIPVILGGDFRSNLTISELAGDAVTVHLVTRDGSGATVNARDIFLNAYEETSVGGLLPATTGSGYVELTITGSGAVGALASLVNNATNDPTTVMMTRRAQRTAAGRLIVPGVAHAAGANNTTWRSDVWVVNTSSTPLRFTSVLYPRGGTNALNGWTYAVPPHAQVTLGDAVMADFNMDNGTGMLLLDVSSGDASAVRMFSRTFNVDSAGGSFGQGVQAVSDATEVKTSDLGLILFGLQRNRSFRTNLQIQETSGSSVTVEISGSATQAGDLTTTLATPYTNVTLGPYEYYQMSDVLSALALPQDATNARVALKVIGGSGSITAYGSIIDSFTGDATTVPAYKLSP